METLIYQEQPRVALQPAPVSSGNEFVIANTKVVDLNLLKKECIIPAFAKDNESTISHDNFIDSVTDTVNHFYHGEQILSPAIRVSHPVKGRIPEAKGKPAHLLADYEKTLYYERMAFVVEVASIRDKVAGNDLSLSVGGIRAYNHENLYSRKTEERFKLFVGFQNHVCMNLCISTDGYKADVRVRTPEELANHVYRLLSEYNAIDQIRQMRELPDYSITEEQFAQLIGRLRMYPYLGKSDKLAIPELTLGDNQINSVVKEYYRDESFCREEDGSINLWRLYNLFTGANKSSYLDTFADRSVDISGFTRVLQNNLDDKFFWYLN